MSDKIFEHPKISGIVLIIIGGAILTYNLKRENRFNFEDFGFLDWQAFLSTWILTILTFVYGVNLLIK
ncbi:hypothetical protein GCM10011416_23980 [Polaribacter pacificus]|uniref:Uncharacterized protein n=1 Tax=Polaribacter pacificus TaxID=1775173 RepID=A0A917I2X5_9FLAO|nr:hypothetical protein [Polaribacter pacificus]GGH04063.1 hypothetical protein GCM10011416_23980 [Polaribacter pacificus]